MKKVIYLSSCDTCKRIMKEVGVDDSFELQDIKFEPIRLDQIEKLRDQVGSYEALINKRAQKLKEAIKLNPITSDEDYRQLLLTHYTFLVRPVFIIGDLVFLGNSKATVQLIKQSLREE